MTKPQLSGTTFCIVLVFFAAATAASAQTLTVIAYLGYPGPSAPQNSGIIAQGRDGNMYSTTGQSSVAGALGDVFRITPGGVITVLHNFNGTDGKSPVSGLTLATNGNFYGTTSAGGKFGYGTIFDITASGSLTTLYSFTNGPDGGGPIAPPIQALDGNFYGTTPGVNGNNGSLYKITPSGVFTTLFSFDGTHGANPMGPLLQGTDGSLYGTTFSGGAKNYGTVFKISYTGEIETLHTFAYNNYGINPVAGLTEGNDGDLYGTTFNGGSLGIDGTCAVGTAFRISPGGRFAELDCLDSVGGNPVAGLAQATDGNFYGTCTIGGATGPALGSIFRISHTGAVADVYVFDYTHGQQPEVTPLQHTNGLLYGNTFWPGDGVFYSLDLGLGPFVTFLPAARSVGERVQILGQRFTGTTAVSFNGTSASFNVESDTFLTATVPPGTTPGSIIVTTPSGTLTSNKTFHVTPQILSFSPSSGPVGTTVVITGNSFTGASQVIVGHLQTPMSFIVNSDTQITAIVPAGAASGAVGVRTPSGKATSPTGFTVTP